jgi:hypothetical protein
MDQQQHEIVFDKTHSSGEDEWYCPTCGRRLLMNYGSGFKKTVLEAGDEYAVHSGAKGGLRMGSVQVASINDTVSQEDPIISSDDPSLAPWMAWLDAIDFESLWNSED